MQCIISSVENTQILKNIHTVTLPIHTGIMQVKTGHAEYFGEIISGEIICSGRKKTAISVPSGVVHVHNNMVTILI